MPAGRPSASTTTEGTTRPPFASRRCRRLSAQRGSGALGSGALSEAQSSEALLAQLPDPSWDRSIIDYSSITFCLHPETGERVKLGCGAFSVVSDRLGAGGCVPGSPGSCI